MNMFLLILFIIFHVSITIMLYKILLYRLEKMLDIYCDSSKL